MMPQGLLWVALASAQDGHGPVATPADGAWSAAHYQPHWGVPGEGPTASLAAAYRKAPLATYVIDGNEQLSTEILLDNVALLDLNASWGLGDRLSISLTAPVFLASGGLPEASGGPALGDVQVWAPIALIQRDEDGGFALSATPYVDLPTGASNRLLGDRGVGGGLWMSAGFEVSRLAFGAVAAVQVRPSAQFPFGKLPAGPWLAIGGSARARLSEALSLGAEGQLRAPLMPVPPSAGLPSELLVSTRYGLTNGLWFDLGAGPGLLAGASSPAFEVFAGAGWHTPAADQALPDVTNPGVALHIVDGDGRKLRSGEVLLGGQLIARADADGMAILPEDVKWKRGVTVRAPGFTDAVVPEPAAGTTTLDVALGWAPTPLRLRVTDQEGRAVAAVVDITGDGTPAGPTPAADGRQEWKLTTGTWHAKISAPGFTAQTREIVVFKGRSEPMLADVVLAPDEGGRAAVELIVTDATGDAVEGAEVFVDGRPVGTTSTGGKIAIEGLSEGKHAVNVGSDVLSGVEKGDVLLTNDKVATVAVAMPFRTGSVIVTVRGPEGRAIDALVRFDGPSTLPPMPLGTDGQRVFVLRPGTWRMLVSSSALGMQQREVLIPEVSSAPIEIEVVLQPEMRGSAEISLAVVDRDGEPVDAAVVSIDGVSYGETSTGGTLLVSGLDPGPHRVEVGGPRFVAVVLGAVDVVDGYQERLIPLQYLPGTVRVQARTPNGEAVNAAIRMAGPGSAGGSLGPTGRAFFQLAPGSWQMLASSDVHGFQTRTIDVPTSATSLVKVDLIMTPAGTGNAGVRVHVVDADGKPVVGAEVSVDGETLGETGENGVVEATGLLAGTHRIDVDSEAWSHLAFERQRLTDGNTLKVEAKLGYAPGTVRIQVRGDQGPVNDAIVRLSGPTTFRPKSVDAMGTRQFVLAPGDWQVLVSSASGGMAQRNITVTSDPNPQVETFTLSTSAGGPAVGQAASTALLVRVRDPGGAPVVGAEVKLDGIFKGTTGKSGAVLITDIDPGKVTLEVASPQYREFVPLSFKLEPGSQERFATLVPVPVALDVVTRTIDGHPLDARLSFTGPIERPAVQVGPDGFETINLPPGHWEVYATAPGLGVKRQVVDLAQNQKAPRLLFDLDVAKVEVGGGSVQILEQVHFELGTNAIDDAEDAILTEVAATLLSRADLLRVEVQGHTDTTGGLALNAQLSLERAQAVRETLIKKGVPPERLVAHGYGPLRPLTENTTEAGRAANRRVEFAILEVAEATP